MNNIRPLEILLVEDNSVDILLAKIFFQDNTINCNIDVATHGEMALEMLQKQGQYASAVTPDIVFLDINMPRIDGRQVLGKMKDDPHLCNIPVAMLTSSTVDKDLIQLHGLPPSCYINKSLDIDKFNHAISSFDTLEWFYKNKN